ncbi:MAG: T9SS type A sorting domain-containing protein [Ignavibacteria bacterium]|nr:T9SS type A sorting domain-containing protein [Ignavibacteria bacterium]
MKKLIIPLIFFLLIIFNQNLFSQPSLITIAEAREDLNMDFIPDRLGDTVRVRGVVISPNYQTSNRSYYIWDNTAGITTFISGLGSPTLALGDEVEIVGFIDHFNGLTEISPLTDTDIVVLSTGNPIPDPQVLTLEQYLNNAEAYESELIGFVNLTKVSGTWPGAGSSATLKVSDGIDSVDLRIDSDTDIDGQPEPAWPQDIIGLGGQFDNSAPYDGGYQILPRYYATDFLPPGTIPVELISFTATVNPFGEAVLNWVTATEINNRGFEIERKSLNGRFAIIGFIEGYGTTSEEKTYSYVDQSVNPGIYVYRLKQIDFNGQFEYSEAIELEISPPLIFDLEQNYPNPFNPSTKISYSVPKSGYVSLKVYNALGQEVAALVNGIKEAGNHKIDFNASNLNSGIYFYKLEAGDFTQVKKMTLIK